MSNISRIYINALLADAAYADGLKDGMSAARLESALSKSMTPTLAKFIADNLSKRGQAPLILSSISLVSMTQGNFR